MESNLSPTPKTVKPDICIDSKLIARYGGTGPRYTSYPTTPHFSDELTADEYQKHALRSNEVLKPPPLSLYVHIPFCQSLCYYCACNKIITRNTNRVCIYMDNLYAEIAMHASLFDEDRVVEQIHFGGGDLPLLNGSINKVRRYSYVVRNESESDTGIGHNLYSL